MVPNTSRTYDFDLLFFHLFTCECCRHAGGNVESLNNSQQWRYYSSNPKWMTKWRGGKILPWSEDIKGKQLPFEHASRYILKYQRAACSRQIRQQVEVCWTTISKYLCYFRGVTASASNEKLGRQDTVQIFQGTVANLYFREKDDWPKKCIKKNIFQFLFIFIFWLYVLPRMLQYLGFGVFFPSFLLHSKTYCVQVIY